MKKPIALAVVFCTTLLAACGDAVVQNINGPVAASRLKFFNFGVNSPGVNFYANAQKMTAISSTTGTESTTGVVQGGVASGGYYSAIAPGSYTLSGTIAAATDKDLAVTKVTTTIADRKYYSFYISGIYDAAAKSIDGFVVEDALSEAFDYTQAYVRFVNASSNSQPMILYAKNTLTMTEVALGAAVAYKAGGTFTALPSGVYDLNTRLSGAAANVITRTAVSFLAGRVYTVGARGDITVTGTTSANRPQLDNTANR